MTQPYKIGTEERERSIEVEAMRRLSEAKARIYISQDHPIASNQETLNGMYKKFPEYCQIIYPGKKNSPITVIETEPRINPNALENKTIKITPPALHEIQAPQLPRKRSPTTTKITFSRPESKYFQPNFKFLQFPRGRKSRR